jgi:hypothetical protein
MDDTVEPIISGITVRKDSIDNDIHIGVVMRRDNLHALSTKGILAGLVGLRRRPDGKYELWVQHGNLLPDKSTGQPTEQAV